MKHKCPAQQPLFVKSDLDTVFDPDSSKEKVLP